MSVTGTTDERGTVTLWLAKGTYAISATAPEGLSCETSLVDVGPPGASVILVMRPSSTPLWVRALEMSGQRPDEVTYALYACPMCKNQLSTSVEDLDVGPPIQTGEVCPICEQTLVTECHRGLWYGGGAQPVEWVGGVDVTAERIEEN